jgi:hypothetical protein
MPSKLTVNASRVHNSRAILRAAFWPRQSGSRRYSLHRQMAFAIKFRTLAVVQIQFSTLDPPGHLPSSEDGKPGQRAFARPALVSRLAPSTRPVTPALAASSESTFTPGSEDGSTLTSLEHTDIDCPATSSAPLAYSLAPVHGFAAIPGGSYGASN